MKGGTVKHGQSADFLSDEFYGGFVYDVRDCIRR